MKMANGLFDPNWCIEAKISLQRSRKSLTDTMRSGWAGRQKFKRYWIGRRFVATESHELLY